MRVKDVFDPAWLLNPAKVFPMHVSHGRRMRNRARGLIGVSRSPTSAAADYHPASEAELAKVIDSCALQRALAEHCRRRHASGRRCRRRRARTLATDALTGIRLYEPAAQTLVVRAGTPLASVEAALAREDQYARLRTGRLERAARHDGALDHRRRRRGQRIGPAAHPGRRGARRRIGLRFVNGGGEIVNSGGRVMKNVTGYDLVKLLCGSWGTLGVITELSFKVMPIPEAIGNGARVTAAAKPRRSDLLAAGNRNRRSTSAARRTASDGKAPATARAVEGLENSVRYRARQLQGFARRPCAARSRGRYPRRQGGQPGAVEKNPRCALVRRPARIGLAIVGRGRRRRRRSSPRFAPSISSRYSTTGPAAWSGSCCRESGAGRRDADPRPRRPRRRPRDADARRRQFFIGCRVPSAACGQCRARPAAACQIRSFRHPQSGADASDRDRAHGGLMQHLAMQTFFTPEQLADPRASRLRKRSCANASIAASARRPARPM